MTDQQPPPVRAYIPTAVLFSLAGWGGIVWLVLSIYPTVGPRWLFFLFWFMALTGTAMPVVAIFNKRFSKRVPATPKVITRQAIWVGFYGCVFAWLQLGRVVTPALSIALALGFVIIEFLLRMREKSEWRP